MTTDTTTPTCGHDWCVVHKPCDCPYAATQPHPAVGCRYHRHDSDQDHDDA